MCLGKSLYLLTRLVSNERSFLRQFKPKPRQGCLGFFIAPTVGVSVSVVFGDEYARSQGGLTKLHRFGNWTFYGCDNYAGVLVAFENFEG